MRVVTWNLEEYVGAESALWEEWVPYLFTMGGVDALLLQGAPVPESSTGATGEESLLRLLSDNTPFWLPELGPPPGLWSYGPLAGQGDVPGAPRLTVLWWKAAGGTAPRCQALVWGPAITVGNLLFVQAQTGSAGIGIEASLGSRQCNLFSVLRPASAEQLEIFVLQAAALGPDWVIGGGFNLRAAVLSAPLNVRACRPYPGSADTAAGAGDYLLNAHGPVDGQTLPNFVAGSRYALLYDLGAELG